MKRKPISNVSYQCIDHSGLRKFMQSMMDSANFNPEIRVCVHCVEPPVCAISGVVVRSPIVCSDGLIYEHDAYDFSSETPCMSGVYPEWLKPLSGSTFYILARLSYSKEKKSRFGSDATLTIGDYLLTLLYNTEIKKSFLCVEINKGCDSEHSRVLFRAYCFDYSQSKRRPMVRFWDKQSLFFSNSGVSLVRLKNHFVSSFIITSVKYIALKAFAQSTRLKIESKEISYNKNNHPGILYRLYYWIFNIQSFNSITWSIRVMKDLDLIAVSEKKYLCDNICNHSGFFYKKKTKKEAFDYSSIASLV